MRTMRSVAALWQRVEGSWGEGMCLIDGGAAGVCVWGEGCVLGKRDGLPCGVLTTLRVRCILPARCS